MENSKVKAYKETALKINPHLVAVKISGYYQIKNGAGHSVSDWFISEDEAWKSVCSCFEVLSEEESKCPTCKGKYAEVCSNAFHIKSKPTNSVEEAAVNYLIETFMDNDVNPDLLKSIYKSCANHIIQSGEYAKLHDIKTMMEYIEVPANKIEQFEKLFIHLKNKQ